MRVPADAEIVIEGRLLPRLREPEGPFGEFPKYYSAREAREVIEIDRVTTRRDPIFHTIVPAEMEHLLLGAIPREATLLAHLQKYKKYPQSAQSRGKEGLNRLRFVVDGEGNVLSFELVGRSGNADLDRATLDMIRRAQPLPKPPADMLNNGSIEIVAPFVYSLERRR